MHVYKQVEKNKFFQLGSLVGGFLDFNCEDDILKNSANKIIDTAKVMVIIKIFILRFYHGFLKKFLFKKYVHKQPISQ